MPATHQQTQPVGSAAQQLLRLVGHLRGKRAAEARTCLRFLLRSSAALPCLLTNREPGPSSTHNPATLPASPQPCPRTCSSRAASASEGAADALSRCTAPESTVRKPRDLQKGMNHGAESCAFPLAIRWLQPADRDGTTPLAVTCRQKHSASPQLTVPSRQTQTHKQPLPTCSGWRWLPARPAWKAGRSPDRGRSCRAVGEGQIDAAVICDGGSLAGLPICRGAPSGVQRLICQLNSTHSTSLHPARPHQ